MASQSTVRVRVRAGAGPLAEVIARSCAPAGNRQWPGGARSTAERAGSSAPSPARKPVLGKLDLNLVGRRKPRRLKLEFDPMGLMAQEARLTARRG